MPKLDDVPTDALVQMMHAAAHREVTVQRAVDREAARRKGLGRWSRVTQSANATPDVDATPIGANEAEADESGAVWLDMAKPTK